MRHELQKLDATRVWISAFMNFVVQQTSFSIWNTWSFSLRASQEGIFICLPHLSSIVSLSCAPGREMLMHKWPKKDFHQAKDLKRPNYKALSETHQVLICKELKCSDNCALFSSYWLQLSSAFGHLLCKQPQYSLWNVAYRKHYLAPSRSHTALQSTHINSG